MSPTKRTRPCASTGRSGTITCMPFLPGKFTKFGQRVMPARTASSPVSTVTTPGAARAAATSSATMRAWARSLRRKQACSCPGRFQSAA